MLAHTELYFCACNASYNVATPWYLLVGRLISYLLAVSLPIPSGHVTEIECLLHLLKPKYKCLLIIYTYERREFYAFAIDDRRLLDAAASNSKYHWKNKRDSIIMKCKLCNSNLHQNQILDFNTEQ